MYHAKKAMRQQNECILVEGYMDVISLYQAGIQNAVASSGTSLTEGQVQLIRRNAENLTILYDGDPAGIKAALRGLDIALEQDLNVRIALLPSGEDPDSYAQKEGGVALRTYISEHAHDFIVFKAQLLSDEAKGDPGLVAGGGRGAQAAALACGDAAAGPGLAELQGPAGPGRLPAGADRAF
jgi:DNA primase